MKKVILLFLIVLASNHLKAQDYLSEAGIRYGVNKGVYYKLFSEDARRAHEFLFSYYRNHLQFTLLKTYYRPIFSEKQIICFCITVLELTLPTETKIIV